MSSHRKDRTNEDIKREIASIIHELKDPRLPVITTVTDVTVTPDLKFAKVYISILEEDKIEKAMECLKSAASFVRHELSKKLKLRNTPELTFVNDKSIANGAYISKLIDDLKSN